MQTVLRAAQLSAHAFSHGFATRLGGVSEGPFASLNLGSSAGDDPAHVTENHRRFAGWVGYEAERLFEVSQVHGRDVRVLRAGDEPARVRQDPADALVTRADGSAVGMRTADCLPILLADPETRCVAAVHAGWRGLVADVIGASVRALCGLSAAPASRLIAAVFPHIEACCFEVGEEVALQLRAAAPTARELVLESAGHKPHVALEVLARLQLMAAGVHEARYERVPGCTGCDATRFYSYRRDGQRSGRHLTAIVGK